MKTKLLLTLLALVSWCGVWADFTPNATKGYKLKLKGTELYVKFQTSYNEDNAINATYASANGSIFRIAQNESGYTFKWRNEYMKTAGFYNWNSGHGTDAANSTWNIVSVDGEDNTYYITKGTSGSVYFGQTNAVQEGTYLYTNQGNGGANVKWVLEEVSMTECMQENGYWPQTSTSNNPIYYTIKNTRCSKYAQYTGDTQKMALAAERNQEANAFWFELVNEDVSADVLPVKIHNFTAKKCVAATNRFTEEGITWYLKADVYTGTLSVAINSNATTWDNNNYGWNNEGGAGNNISSWSSTDIGSAWWIEEFEIDIKNINYTVTDQNGAQYSGTYEAEWAGNETATPSIPGAYGATFTNAIFTENAGSYSMTATIDFGFPVSSNGVENATGLQSQLGSSKWFANGEDKVLANKEANTKIYTSNVDRYKWLIIPSLNNGSFSFKLKNVGADKYIPANASTGPSNATTLVDEANAGSFYFCHINTGNGFATSLTSNKFLTINSSSTNQNIWIWQYSAGNGHQGSNMSFPEISATVDDEQVNAEFAALAGLQMFTLVEGATVISPSEYAAPAQINAAIEAYNAVEDNVEAKVAFLTSDNASKLTAFKSASASYGDPLEFTWSIKANKWGTLFSPVNFTKPSELTLYTCAGASDEGVLNIQTSGSAKNKPFLVKNTANTDKTYQIIGYANGAATQNVTEGLLTGVIEEDSKVPFGSYILATQNGEQAFYRVDTENYTIAVNKCYITMPTASGAKVLRLDDESIETAIDGIGAVETENGVIYNLVGQKLNALQKGINIINGKKVLVK